MQPRTTDMESYKISGLSSYYTYLQLIYRDEMADTMGDITIT